jgi:hypothetical protein
MILGLVLLTIGAGSLVRPMRRSGALPGWAGVLFAVGLGLWLPLLPRPVRIIDGISIGVGGLALASALWRGARATAARPISGSREAVQVPNRLP